MTAEGRWFRLNTTWSQSDWLAALSPAARLAWVELLGHVKAHGFDGKLRSVTRNAVSRMYNIPAEDVGAMLEAAQEHGAITIEEGELCVVKWGEYQGDPTGAERVKRYREKKNKLRVTTVTLTPVTATETETETELQVAKATLSSSGKPNVDPGRNGAAVREVFDYWREKTGHKDCLLTTDRKTKIQSRLRVFTVEQLKRAIDAASVDSFLQGDNDRGKRFDYPETIFKNDASAEKWMHAANGARAGPNGKYGTMDKPAIYSGPPPRGLDGKLLS